MFPYGWVPDSELPDFVLSIMSAAVLNWHLVTILLHIQNTAIIYWMNCGYFSPVFKQLGYSSDDRTAIILPSIPRTLPVYSAALQCEVLASSAVPLSSLSQPKLSLIV